MTTPRQSGRQSGRSLRPQRSRVTRAPLVTLNAVSAAVMALAGLPAYAQQQPASETVNITGIRKGIEDAISVKKNADSIVDAVSAEDIGKLPDATVAESLSRVPGVAIQRSSVTGRAAGVSVRGMSPDFNGGLLNGREQASTAANRGVEFDQFPAELLSTLIVHKTPDAALLGQGLSSTINQLTVRPLDFGRRTGSVAYRREFNERAEKGAGFGSGSGDRLSLSYIDQFADRTLGVALGFSRYDAKGGGRPNFQTWGGWTPTFDIATGARVDNADTGCAPPAQCAIVPGGFTSDIETINTKRDALMATLQYKPNKDFESVLDVFWSKGDFSLQKRGLEGPLGGLSAGPNDPGGRLTNATVANIGGRNVVTGGTFTDYKGVIRNHNEDFTDELQSIGWNNKFKVGGWTLMGDLATSRVTKNALRYETTAGLPGNAAGAFAQPNDTITFTNFNGTNLDQVRYTTGLNYADPNLVRLTDVQGWAGSAGVQDGYYANPVTKDKINSARLSAKPGLSFGPVVDIEFGGNVSDRSKTRVTREGALILPGAVNASGAVVDRFASAPIPGASVGSGGPTGIPVLAWNPAGSLGSVYTLNAWSDPDIAAKSWGVKEKVFTGFVKGDFDGKFGNLPYRGNVGVQFVATDQNSTGNTVDRASCNGATHSCTYVPFSAGVKYHDVLPSLNLTFDLGNDSVLRFGLGRQLARASMDDLRPSYDLSVNSNSQTLQANGGNPKLKPFRANAVDLSYEKYFGRSGYVSAAAFYKDLDSYILKVGRPADLSSLLLPSTTIPAGGVQGILTTPQNGKGGTIQGVELAVNVPFNLLTRSLEGFGVMLNASYTDSSLKLDTSGFAVNGIGTTTVPLPGLSKLVTNLRVYYESGGFQIGIARRDRSSYLGSITDFQDNTQLVFIKGEAAYDLQASYEIRGGPAKGLSFLLQGNNLTNTPQVRFDEATGNTTERKRFGAQYLVGLNYKF